MYSVTLCAVLMAVSCTGFQQSGDNNKPGTGGMSPLGSGAEDFILSRLNLTQDQIKQLHQNQSVAERRYQTIREQFQRDGDLWAKVRGYEAVATWNKSETKRIMTPEQHAKYRQLWNEAMSPYLANSAKIKNARSLLPDQGNSYGPISKP